MFQSSFIRLFAVLILAVVIMGSAFGFAATNTVPDSVAGEGSGTISGVTVSNLDMTLSEANPSLITQVQFTAAFTSGSSLDLMKVQLENGGNWYDCTASGTGLTGETWTCNTTTPAQAVSSADQLTVLAAD
jgi:hypothetical protein